MGPYCNYCDQRCFVYLPALGSMPPEMRKAYRNHRHIDIIATCPGGQALEKKEIGYSYDDIKALRAEKYKGYTTEEAYMALWNAGYKDVTEEANEQNKRTDFAAFADPSGVGVHYCEFDYDVVELALDTELLAIKDEAGAK
jgi:hypothetical protein